MELYTTVSFAVFLWLILRDMETPLGTILAATLFWPVFAIVGIIGFFQPKGE